MTSFSCLSGSSWMPSCPTLPTWMRMPTAREVLSAVVAGVQMAFVFAVTHYFVKELPSSFVPLFFVGVVLDDVLDKYLFQKIKAIFKASLFYVFCFAWFALLTLPSTKKYVVWSYPVVLGAQLSLRCRRLLGETR